MFKCPICGGKTKARQTRHPKDEEVVIRKWQCLTCGQYFFTREEFWKYTEQTIRNAGQKVTTRIRGSNFKDPNAKEVSGKELFEIARKQKEGSPKVRLVGSRSPEKDAMIKMVTESEPMTPQDWMKFYDEYAKNVDMSDVGVIPPEV